MNGDPTIDENPFATRYVRPGAIAYRLAAGQTMETLVARLRAHGWWGQIIGPHGSGKSTLVATLIPKLERAGRRPVVVRLGGPLRGPIPRSTLTSCRSPQTQLVIDGYEQLGCPRRWLLRRTVHRLGGGLLVTAHRPVGLPDLVRTDPNQATVLDLVRNLLGHTWTVIDPEDVAESYARRQGNVREVLFDLYDLFERRRHCLRSDTRHPGSTVGGGEPE